MKLICAWGLAQSKQLRQICLEAGQPARSACCYLFVAAPLQVAYCLRIAWCNLRARRLGGLSSNLTYAHNVADLGAPACRMVLVGELVDSLKDLPKPVAESQARVKAALAGLGFAADDEIGPAFRSLTAQELKEDGGLLLREAKAILAALNAAPGMRWTSWLVLRTAGMVVHPQLWEQPVVL